MKTIYLTLIFFSLSVFSQQWNGYLPRKLYMGFEAGLSALEMALPNAQATQGSDIDLSLFEPDYSPNLGLYAGVEIWDRYYLSPFIEANVNYSRAHTTDPKDECAIEGGANSSFTSVNYSIIHLDASAEVGVNLNLRLKKFIVSPFVSAEFGLAWRTDKANYTKTGTDFNRTSKSKFTNAKLNLGLRIINLANYFSAIKVSYSNLTTTSQENSFDIDGVETDSNVEFYEQDNQSGAKGYFSLTLGGGVYF